MADAEDLKSSGDFSSCGFDSHPVRSGFEQEHDEVGELASSNEDFGTSWAKPGRSRESRSSLG